MITVRVSIGDNPPADCASPANGIHEANVTPDSLSTHRHAEP